MLSRYIHAAGSLATYRLIEDGTIIGEIPGFEGIWASSDRLEACREELEEVLEDWILIRVSQHLELPVAEGIELRVREVA